MLCYVMLCIEYNLHDMLRMTCEIFYLFKLLVPVVQTAHVERISVS